MITKFKIFESKKFVLSDNSYWVIYGNKRKVSNILISILNDNLIKDYNLTNRIRQFINSIEVSLNYKSQDIMGVFLYYIDGDIATAYFRDQKEKEFNMKNYYKNSIFRGELKLNYFGEVVFDPTEADMIKYNL